MTSTVESNASDWQKLLHYGAQISISLAEDYSHHGFVIGDGFITKNITYKEAKAFDTEDFAGTIFRVLPSFLSTAQNALESKLLKDFDQPEMQLNAEVQALMDAAEEEMKQNLQKAQKVKKKPIVLGSPLQLLHVKSQKYLSFHFEDQQYVTLAESLQFKLVENPSEDTVFRILPSYKFQSEKDKLIKFADHVYLCSGSDQVSRNAFLYIDVKSDAAIRESEPSREGAGDSGTEDDQILISIDKSSRLKLSLFSEAVEREHALISFGDIIWLQHVEKENYLIFDNNKDHTDLLNKGFLPENYRAAAHGLHFFHIKDSEARSSNGMWKLESVDKFLAARFSWSSLFRLRHLSTGLYLTLKPLPNGGHSAICLEAVPTEDSILQFSSSEQVDMQTDENRNSPVTIEDMTRVRHVKTNRWLSLTEYTSLIAEGSLTDLEEEMTSILSAEPQFIQKNNQEDVFRFIKAKDKEIWETYILISSYPVLKNSTQLIKMIYDLIDEDGNFPLLSSSREYQLNLIKHCVVSIITFLNDVQSDTASLSLSLKTNNARQKMLKEQGFIKLLADILAECFPDQESLDRVKKMNGGTKKRQVASINAGRNTLWQDLQENYNMNNVRGGGVEFIKQQNQMKNIAYLSQICLWIYELLRAIAKNNPENEIECFKHIEVMKRQAGYQIGATRCIISIFEKNERLLYSLYSNPSITDDNKGKNQFYNSNKPYSTNLEPSSEPTLLEYFVSQLKDSSAASRRTILRLLSSACKCESQGITINQTLILTKMVKDEEISKIALLKFRCKGTQIMFEIFEEDRGSKMAVTELSLSDVTMAVDKFQNSIKYLEEQLDLYSSLCFDRNYVCKQSIQEILPMAAITHNIWDRSIPKNIRGMLVKLLTNAYIDSYPRTTLVVPQLVRPFDPEQFEKNRAYTIRLTRRNSLALSKAESIGGRTESLRSESQNEGLAHEMQPSVDDEELIEELKSKLLDFLNNSIYADVVQSQSDRGRKAEPSQAVIEFDVYLLNLVMMAHKMAVFGLYSGSQFTNLKFAGFGSDTVTFPFRKKERFTTRSELAQLVYVLFPILFVQSSSAQVASDEMPPTKEPESEPSSENVGGVQAHNKGSEFLTDISEKFERASKQLNRMVSLSPSASLMTKKRAETGSRNKANSRPVTRKGKTLKSEIEESLIKERLRKVAMNQREIIDQVEMQVRKEILLIMHFALNVRADYLVTNAVHYFINKVLPVEFTTNRDAVLTQLIEKRSFFPSLMNTEHHEEEVAPPDVIYNSSRFVEDLDRMTGSCSIKNILYLFVRTTNYELESITLNLMFKSFSQRSTLVRFLRMTDLLFTQDEITLFNFAATRCHELENFVDQSELWLLNRKKDTKVIDTVNQILEDLTNCFYSSVIVDPVQSSSRLLHVPKYHDDSEIGYSRQSMMHSLLVHKIVLRLAKDATSVLESLQEETVLSTELNLKLVQLFKSCYSILLFLCKNDHKKTRKTLTKSLNTFALHLPMYQVGQSEVICEIYKDSKLGLNVSDDLINTFFNIIKRKGHNPSYLLFFETIINETHPEILQDNVHKILLLFNDPEKRYVLAFMEHSQKYGQYELNLKTDGRLESDYPFVYHAKILRLLQNLYQKSQNKSFARLVIQKLIPISTILRLLQKNDCYCAYESKYKKDKALLYSLLKLPLIQLLKNVWIDVDNKVGGVLVKCKFLGSFLDKESAKLRHFDPVVFRATMIQKQKSEKRTRDIRDTIIDSHFYQIVRDDFPEASRGRTASKSKIVVDLKEEYRYTYDYHCYLLEYLLPITTRLNIILTSPDMEHTAECKQQLRGLLDFSMGFKEHSQKIKKPVLKNIPQFLSEYAEFLEVFMLSESEVHLSLDEADYSPEPNRNRTKTLLDDHIDPSIDQKEYIRLNSTLKNHTFIDERDDKGKQKLWKSFILNVSMNESVRKQVQKERDSLVRAVRMIESYNYSGFRTDKITLESLIRKIIMHVQVCTDSLHESDSAHDSMSGCILLLADLLKGCESRPERKFLQNLMFKTQAVRMACGVFFKKDMKSDISKLMIYFCTQLLDGGNSEIQGAFYEQFVKDPDSMNFFHLLHTLVSNEITKNARQLSSLQKAEAVLQKWHYSDYLFHFDLSIVLRLIQLFVEGHHSELQAYFKNQFYSKHSYNMINLLVKLTEVLQQNLTEDKYFVLQQCLETITEFIQGPCYENQDALANSRFLEFATLILRINESSNSRIENKVSMFKLSFLQKLFRSSEQEESATASPVEEAIVKYFYSISPSIGQVVKAKLWKNSPKGVHDWMISRIKYKTLITLESLLEGRTDDFILQKMIKALPLSALASNICEIYTLISNHYGKDKYTAQMFNHADLDPYDPKVNSSSLSLIIETGFSAYKILRIYLDFAPAVHEAKDEKLLAILEARAKVNTILRQNAGAYETWERLGNEHNEHTVSALDWRSKKKCKGILDTVPKFKEAFLFFYKHSAHIEILRDDHLFKTYFVVLPSCTYCNQSIQDGFHDDCNRSSAKTKCASLLEHSDEIISVLKHEEKLATYFESSFATKFLTSNIRLYKNISLVVCIIQNILIAYSNTLYTFQSADSEDQPQKTLDSYLTLCRKPMRTFVRFDFWGLIKTDDVDNGCWCTGSSDNCERTGEFDVITMMKTMCSIQSVTSGLILVFFLLKNAPILWRQALQKFQVEEEDYSMKHLFGLKKLVRTCVRGLAGLLAIFTNWNVLYYFGYTLCAILGGYFVDSPSTYYLSNFFIALLMLDLIRRSPLLHHITSSIWRPREAIMLALLLFFVLEYIFSVVAFIYFPRDYQGACITLSSCFFRTIDNTFKADGGIGGYLISISSGDDMPDPRDPEATNLNTGRFAFDNTFNFILVILLVQMISGIIIDTFAVLREEDAAREDDMNNYCFICGFDRQTLDKKSNRKGFTHHIRYEHNLWHYLYYIAYVKNKEKTECSGMESYIADLIDKGEIEWFPIDRNSELEDDNDVDTERAVLNRITTSKLAELRAAVKTLEARISMVHSQVNVLRN